MTRLHGSRLTLLVLSAFVLSLALLTTAATKAHAQSAVDQYLENNNNGKGSKGGSSGGSSGGGSANPGSGGSSGSSGSGSGSGSGGGGATKDYNGDGAVDSTDDQIYEKKQKAKKKKKEKEEQTSGVAGAGDDGGTGGSTSSPELAKAPAPVQNDDGGSGALWIVLALLILGPAAVFAWLRFGPRRRSGPSEPQGT